MKRVLVVCLDWGGRLVERGRRRRRVDGRIGGRRGNARSGGRGSGGGDGSGGVEEVKGGGKFRSSEREGDGRTRGTCFRVCLTKIDTEM